MALWEDWDSVQHWLRWRIKEIDLTVRKAVPSAALLWTTGRPPYGYVAEFEIGSRNVSPFVLRR